MSPESSRDVMNGHISNMKENSSAGAAEDSSRLHKASQRHMTESDAAGDKYGLAVESRHKGRSVVCSGRQQKILPLGRQCVSCVETLFISPSGPREHHAALALPTYARAAGRRSLGAARGPTAKKEMIRISRR